MYKDLENQKFDFLILGTNLTESALSAYLAKSKYKIIQIDISKSYGGDCKNFNLRDMEIFIKELKEKTLKDNYLKNINLIKHEISKEIEPILEKENYRQYNFDLNPKFIYAKSKSTSELIDSKASNYIEFNSVRKIFFMCIFMFGIVVSNSFAIISCVSQIVSSSSFVSSDTVPSSLV